MDVQEMRIRAGQRLTLSGSPDPEPDADWLICAALHCSRGELRHMRRALTRHECTELEGMLMRRESGEPLQYIIGTQPFLQYELHTDARALIPRCETEELCLLALAALRDIHAPSVLDIGTGTGALAISIALSRRASVVTAVDISPDAAALARENARTLNANVEVLVGDLFAPVKNRRFDMIVSNPPYIPSGELAQLQREVRHEPMLALDGGADGLDFYRRLADEARAHLNAGGRLLVECGVGQASKIARMFAERIGETSITRDMQGIDRIVAVTCVARTEP